MNNIYKVTFLFSSFAFIMMIMSFSNSPLAIETTLEKIESQYQSDFDQFFSQVQKLNQTAQIFSEKSTPENQNKLQLQVANTRLAYKRIEFLLDFLDSEFANSYLNGAPLPKLMKHVPEITVIDPNGLQTIDELAFLEPIENAQELKKLSSELYTNTKKIKQYHAHKKFEHRFIIEALRYGIVRVFSLALTGFDTPGSGNAIPEAILSMETMKNTLTHYQLLNLKDSQSELDAILSIYSASIDYLNDHDFDSVDRLYFLRNFADPLYNKLLQFQINSNIELKKEADRTLYPHNYESNHIFSDDFFNAAYYTKIAASDLNDPKKIELGKILFYDPIMSRDLNMNCASCHNPQKGFTDGLPKAQTSTEGVFTDRHSPTLLNSALYGRYFWDMREYDLERQVKHVVHNELEFNMDFIDLADRLKKSTEYLMLFEDAYGDRDKYKISTWSISNALAAYVNSLTSYNSDFDKYARGESDYIDAEVRKGFNLFMGKAACGTCHFAPSFSGLVPPFYSDSESEVLGITTSFDTINPILDDDPGRIANGLAEEEAPHYYRSMKTVTVRNGALTAPYMHNGSLNTLEEVMHFYNKGGGAGMGLDIENQTLPDTHLGLNQGEMNSLVTFIESLTDTVGMIGQSVVFPSFENNPEWNDRQSY